MHCLRRSLSPPVDGDQRPPPPQPPAMQFQLFVWGANSHGQLGLGHVCESVAAPMALPDHLIPAGLELPHIKQICGGGGHLFLLTHSGQLFVSGWNHKGQAGIGVSVPTAISKFQAIDAQHFAGGSGPVCAVRAGWDCSAAMLSGGDVFVWGSNTYEQLNVARGQLQYAIRPRKIRLPGGIHTTCIDIQFGLRSIAFNTGRQILVISASERHRNEIIETSAHPAYADVDAVTQVNYLSIEADAPLFACGANHLTYLVEHDGVYHAGENRQGQLERWRPSAPPVGLPAVRQLRTGWSSNGALTDAGEVFMWGRNDYAQLGRPEVGGPTPAPLQLPPVAEGVDGRVRDLHLGAEHGLVVRNNGDVCTWGWNEHGTCGDGTEVTVAQPKRVALPRACVMAGVGSGFCVALVQRFDG